MSEWMFQSSRRQPQARNKPDHTLEGSELVSRLSRAVYGANHLVTAICVQKSNEIKKKSQFYFLLPLPLVGQFYLMRNLLGFICMLVQPPNL
jgi:hypothetical protein